MVSRYNIYRFTGNRLKSLSLSERVEREEYMFTELMASGSGGGNITATAPIKKAAVNSGLDVPAGCTEGILILNSWGNAYTSEPSPTPVGCTYELIGKVGSIYTEIFTWVWKIVPTASKITFSNITYLSQYGTVTLAYNA